MNIPDVKDLRIQALEKDLADLQRKYDDLSELLKIYRDYLNNVDEARERMTNQYKDLLTK